MARRKVIGIFSREHEERYRWLIDFLLPLRRVRDVRPVYISNNGHQDFSTELSKCTFAILYHSKKRGRVNITDVTDALYDEELKALSRRLGRENVIVVADHLDDISEEQKLKILKNQPSIWTESRDLLLFGSDVPRSQKDNNLRQIKDIIEEYAFPKYFIWAAFAALVSLLVLILVLSLRSGHQIAADTEMTTNMTTIITTDMTINPTTDMIANMTTVEMTTDMTANMTTNMTTMEMTTNMTMNMTTMEMTTNMTMNMTTMEITTNMTTEMTINTTTEMTTDTTMAISTNTTLAMTTDLPTNVTGNLNMGMTTKTPTTMTTDTATDTIINAAAAMTTNLVLPTTEKTLTMYHPRSTKLTPTPAPGAVVPPSSHSP